MRSTRREAALAWLADDAADRDRATAAALRVADDQRQAAAVAAPSALDVAQIEDEVKAELAAAARARLTGRRGWLGAEVARRGGAPFGASDVEDRIAPEHRS
jgi:hypothetical protein